MCNYCNSKVFLYIYKKDTMYNFAGSINELPANLKKTKQTPNNTHRTKSREWQPIPATIPSTAIHCFFCHRTSFVNRLLLFDKILNAYFFTSAKYFKIKA